MNNSALRISINSLIESGNKICSGKIDSISIRNYIDLYEKIIAYIRINFNNDKSAKLLRSLPIIEMKKFNNPFYLINSFFIDHLKLSPRFSDGISIGELLNIQAYPKRAKYIDNLTTDMCKISKLFVEFLI